MLDSQPSKAAVEVRPDRRAARREATKNDILEAAWSLAREHGLAALSMRDLAAAVDMQAPSLYQYFDSKLAIYDAMFGQGMRDALATVTAEIDASDRRSALAEVGRRVVEFATSDPVRAQLLFLRTIPDFDPSPDSYAPAVEMSAWVQALLVEMGVTDPDAMDLWTGLMGGLVAQQLANEPGGTRWTRLVDRCADMFLTEMTRAPQKGNKK